MTTTLPIPSQNKEKFNNKNLAILAVSGATGALAVGYGFAIVAGTLLYIDRPFPDITLEQRSRFVSFAVLGGTIGAALAGSITEQLGRKFSILLSSFLLIIGYLLLVISNSINLYCIWRLIIGFGMGLNMMSAQLFMSESSPNELRGQIGSTYILCVFVGMISAHLSSIIFEYQLQLMFGIGVIPPLIQAMLMIFTQHESPIYLAHKKRNIQAQVALKRFYNLGSNTGQREFEDHCKEIFASVNSKENDLTQVQLYQELFTKYRWNLFVAVMLHVLQQFTGINIVNFYGPSILKDAGFAGDSNRDLLLSMTFLTLVNTISNLIGAIMAKSFGRRQLIMMFSFPMAIALLLLDGVMFIKYFYGEGFAIGGWIGVMSLAGYLVFFCIGFATQAWTISAEVFPNHLRGIANSITTTSNWLFNYVTSAIFLLTTSTEIGKIISYSVLALSCIVTYLFVMRYMPETKDKPIEECVKLVQLSRIHGCQNALQLHNDTKGLLDSSTTEYIQLAQKISINSNPKNDQKL